MLLLCVPRQTVCQLRLRAAPDPPGCCCANSNMLRFLGDLSGLSDGCNSSRGALGFELRECAHPTAAVGAGPLLLLATAATTPLVGLATRAVHLAAAATVCIAVRTTAAHWLLRRAVAWTCAIAVADGTCLLLLLQVTCTQPQGTITYECP